MHRHSAMESAPLTGEWLAACLRGEDAFAPVLCDVSRDEAIDQARLHGLLPLLAFGAGKANRVPPAVLEELDAYARREAAREMVTRHEMNRVLADLHANGIEYLLIKGGALCHTLYPQPYLRPRVDTDMLFPSRDAAEAACRVLERRGYTRRPTTTGDYVGYQFSCAQRLPSGMHCEFDIHREVNDYPYYARRLGYEELAARSIPIPGLPGSTRCPEPVDALLIACIHFVTNLALGISDRLIWVYDIHLLGQDLAPQGWQELLERATRKQLCGTVAAGMRNCETYFPAGAPAGFLAELEQRSGGEPLRLEGRVRRADLYWASLKSLPDHRARARMVREHLFPDPAYMRARYRARNPLLLPLLYVHRVASGLRRYF